MEKTIEQKTEPARTIHHTEAGGHSVDGREILRSERAQKLISEVAEKLKVPGSEKSAR